MKPSKNEKFDVTKSRKEKKRKLTLKEWSQEKFIPHVAKIGNQRHLAAIRDSFGTMIPLIIAGSIGILISAIIFGGAGSGYVSLLGLICKMANSNVAWGDLNDVLATGGWNQTTQIAGYAFGIINTVTVGMMAIWFSFLFGYFIAIAKNFQNPLVAGLVSGSAFMLSSLGEVTFFMGAQGLISAILFGILATELFLKLSEVKTLNLKLPAGVPPAVGKSFAVFLPVCITLSVVAVINIAVLAPAIVTQKLHVDQNTYLILNAGTGQGSFADLFNKNYDVDEFIKTYPIFADQSDLLAKTFNQLTNGTPTEFISFYDGLGYREQATVATALATLTNAPGSGEMIGSITKSAKITFIQDGNSYMATISWMEIILKPTQFGMGAAIYKFFTTWFISFATGTGGIGLAILFAFGISFFWFFGVHGSNLMAGIFEPIWWMILGINTALVTSMGYDTAVASQGMGVFTKPFFDSYMYVGGSGATLGLLIMTLSFSKRKELKEVAKYATPAGVFQINEPTIFGYPLILNPIYVTPFVLAPIINVLIGWIFSPAVLGWVKYSYVATPWTAPWFISAMITSLDVRALIPAFIIFILDMLLYLPFALLDNKLYFKKLLKNDPKQYDLEMRYYTDAPWKWEVDTKTKVDSKINKAEQIISDAEEVNEFWAKKITNPEKLKIRQDELMTKATIKQEKLVQEAKIIQEKRDAKAITYQPKWEKQHLKKVKKEQIRLDRQTLKAEKKQNKADDLSKD